MACGQRSALSWHPLHSAADRNREREDKKRDMRERVMIEEEHLERSRKMKEGSENGNVMFSS